MTKLFSKFHPACIPFISPESSSVDIIIVSCTLSGSATTTILDLPPYVRMYNYVSKLPNKFSKVVLSSSTVFSIFTISIKVTVHVNYGFDARDTMFLMRREKIRIPIICSITSSFLIKLRTTKGFLTFMEN